MKVLFYISDKIGGDDIIYGLLELSIDVVRSELVVELDNIDERQIEIIALESKEYDCVMTRSFSVNVAEGCHIADTPYIAWCYDAPVKATYRKEALYGNNHIFVFDKMQLRRLKDAGLKNVYYQPLAANMIKASIVTISEHDIDQYARDISFIGSMYNRGFYKALTEGLDDHAYGECEQLINENLCKWGEDHGIFDKLSEDTIKKIYDRISKTDRDKYCMSDRFLTELLALVPESSFRERIKIIEECGQRFNTIVHTYEPDRYAGILSARIEPPVTALSEELYRIYAAAAINLNITMRSIETGVPQRVFDIMSVGGCVFSNYQKEAEELFEPDREIVLFRSIEELIDKAGYYLKHEKERLDIGARGYLKVRNRYNYPNAIKSMFDKVFEG